VDVGVFGSSLPRPREPAYDSAIDLGREIARRGARVVCGGYGGVMEAVCRGAVEAGGSTRGVVLSGRGEPNAWLTETIVAPDLASRLKLLRDGSDAWIFLPHGLGTMLELVWMAESLVKGEARPRRLVVLGDFWRGLVEFALAEASDGGGAASLRGEIRFTASPSEAASAALDARASPAGGP
jgi:uncharacterized protein (TIGR00730 family)